MRRLLAILLPAFLAGCARFHPQPLSPADTAARLDRRSLTSLDLKVFLEQNLHRTFETWPATNWDFETLALAAFYYQPSLEVARADWQVATAGQTTAAERPNPTVSASGIYEPAAGAFSPWIPGLVFDLPIETAGKRRLRTEQARHLSEAARYNVVIAAWHTRAQLRTSLVDYAAAQERMGLLNRDLAVREELLARLESQLQAGAISPFELNTARLALIKARADLSEAVRAALEARTRLADAIGLSVTGLGEAHFEFALDTSPTADQLSSKETRDLALQGRADILAALSDYAASQSALQLEVAKQYPDIHLSPGYSWNAGSTGEHDWQIGATVELPLLNRHEGPIAEAAARRNASAARFMELQSKIIGEIDGALVSFQASQSNAVALVALSSTQAARRQAVTAQFEAGAVDRLEVLAAETELNTAELSRLDAQLKLQQAYGAVEDALQRPLNLPPMIFQSRSKPQNQP